MSRPMSTWDINGCDYASRGGGKMKTESWIIRNKFTGEVIAETFLSSVATAINTEKYEVIPILDYLISMNGKEEKHGNGNAETHK